MFRNIIKLFFDPLKYLLLLLLIPNLSRCQAWKFIVYGDTRTYHENHRSVLEAMVTYSSGYEFIINTGDLAGYGLLDWPQWYAVCEEVLGGLGQDSRPPRYMACPGNADDSLFSDYLWGQKEQFGKEGRFFTFDFNNARFVLLEPVYHYTSETNFWYLALPDSQFQILNRAIQTNPHPWFFVFWHYPLFDFADKGYQKMLNEQCGSLLYEYGCDILFNGHAHQYTRTKKLALNGDAHPPIDPDYGIPQIVTGNGGAILYPVIPNRDQNEYMLKICLDVEYGYCELTVFDDSLQLEHILRTGDVFDRVTYLPNPKIGKTVVFKSSQNVSSVSIFQSNYPNPFNSETTISWRLAQVARVTVKIYNSSGQLLEEIFNGRQSAGTDPLSG